MAIDIISEIEVHKSRALYDSLGGIVGVDANTSQQMANPNKLLVEDLAVGSKLSVQVRPIPNAIWYEFLLVDGATNTDAIV